ncbi:ATP-binding protein [Nostoc sp. UHCC 0870]|uniref:ATP-binding protein n=1 Tax=Nostoc sp. UHCC 0870 TaxID=2914041 RepID=UPI001EDCF34F|nr:ATP-binding protein [Nostoc sp. UHCC 0870]UKP00390.1 ATP-binding protein [Nostoc sp. UHCC 0870]
MLAIDSISNANEIGLQLDSTLEALPRWEVQCELHLPGNRLIKNFEQETFLPGIILTKNQGFVGMISRKQFFEYMSRPYSLGLFSMRPIENLYNCLQPEMCIFDQDMTIVEATQMALQRSPELVYEPILIKSQSGNYGIVDFHQLLLANSQIHALTLAQLQQVEEQSQLAKAGFRDLKKNYSRLLQNEKMAALGQLVAGIAHEVNNPINFIAGNIAHVINYSSNFLDLIKLYQKYYPHPVDEITTAIYDNELEFIAKDLPDLLSSMQAGCKRITQIVLSLRNFSRLDESDRKIVDIHEGIDSTLLILQSRLKYHKNNQNISVIKEYGNLPLVDCYAGLLNQVFMNILTNAIDALEESIVNSQELTSNNYEIETQLQICIRTENINNQQVMIRIADNGLGIPDDIKNRLFDPFFTTKPVGKGTGLGLSICHQIIVEKHGGQIYCVSTVGKGSEFIIHIPVNS